MSAYQDLQKSVLGGFHTDLEKCVLFVGRPLIYDIEYIDAEAAAAELAAQRARIAELETENNNLKVALKEISDGAWPATEIAKKALKGGTNELS